jgi:hypothetical protein
MMYISIPDAIQPLLERKALRAGFASAEEYAIQILLSEMGTGSGDESDAWLREALAGGADPASVPQEAIAKRRREIEAMLLEGLGSGPATELTAEDWGNIRREVRERRTRP